MASQAAFNDIKKQCSKGAALEKAYNEGIQSFKHYLSELPERQRQTLIKTIEKQIN